jgi:hypothetical protein
MLRDAEGQVAGRTLEVRWAQYITHNPNGIWNSPLIYGTAQLNLQCCCSEHQATESSFSEQS